MKAAHLHMRLEQDLKDRISREARRMNIDVSALVSLVLSDWLEKREPPPKNGVGDHNEPHEAAEREEA